jgi:hypothetical protein
VSADFFVPQLARSNAVEAKLMTKTVRAEKRRMWRPFERVPHIVGTYAPGESNNW